MDMAAPARKAGGRRPVSPVSPVSKETGPDFRL
jgi:hypothetical protein